jgi:hypothetical protein
MTSSRFSEFVSGACMYLARLAPYNALGSGTRAAMPIANYSYLDYVQANMQTCQCIEFHRSLKGEGIVKEKL